jgi:hypothetical protein
MAIYGQKVLVELWQWRYEDPVTGHARRTIAPMTANEARRLPNAERIPGSLQFHEVDVEEAGSSELFGR